MALPHLPAVPRSHGVGASVNGAHGSQRTSGWLGVTSRDPKLWRRVAAPSAPLGAVFSQACRGCASMTQPPDFSWRTAPSFPVAH